ncbi:Chlorophyllide a oxygenase, chloroplastic [Apostasia shenzhenica]|uniref:Chlorophyllide a oxygenase, chloroplastic n=1 Tax=Apostasia shenzhenica TaxID=1088818 RepID=A0A2I0BAF4_9ASPA|nr:Chlorophyllide a oxygenase, chloroplastic [Apostasia shenzhenica]
MEIAGASRLLISNRIRTKSNPQIYRNKRKKKNRHNFISSLPSPYAAGKSMTAAAALSLLPTSLRRPSSSYYSKKASKILFLALIPVEIRFRSVISSNKWSCAQGGCCREGIRVFAVYGEEGEGGLQRKSGWAAIFEVADPRSRVPPSKGKYLDVNEALEVARFDIQYCDWRARQDLLTIMLLHDKALKNFLVVVVEVLNPLAREFKSIGTMKKELAELQEELAKAHKEVWNVHISEARVAAALDKLAYVETLVNDRLLQDRSPAESCNSISLDASTSASHVTKKMNSPRRSLDVSGPVKPYNTKFKNFWYPVVFSMDLKDDTMVPIDCFEEPWVLFRGKDGNPGCVQNTCAHRACPLHLGSVNEGRIQCPYHGWEYSTDGKCQKMPSTPMLDVRIKALPCFEHEGMIWIWPGDAPPAATLPSLQPPPGFEVHAEIVLELPVEHGLLLDNLLDLAHAPFTHTSTFAKGWSVPSLVKFLTPESGLQGYWDPYPIDMEFRPPCMVLSTIGISKPGKLQGQSTRQCSTHLHQLHVCLPSSRQKTRLLYRMSLDFAPVLKHIPFMHILWRHFAEKVLNEDLRLVIGQQDRMINGANVWNLPMTYDKLGIRYRLWRDAVERGAKQLPFTKQEG